MKRRVHEEEELGELNVVPYLDIVTNLVMFMMLSMAGLITLGIVDVATPKIGSPADAQAAANDQPQQPQLTLTVGISDKGFYLAGTGGVVGNDAGSPSGGLDASRPPTLPRQGPEYDYSGLTRILSTVKDRFPKESRVILVAEMDIPYDVIIRTMDASRELVGRQPNGDPQVKTLFPEVMLSMMQ